MEFSCFVCSNNNWRKKYNDLLQCKNCGFIRAQDKFFKLNPRLIYNEKYFQQGSYKDYQLEEKALVKNFKDNIKRLYKYKQEGNLLEIGCAYGYFLKEAKRYFKTFGIDLDERVVKKARGISETEVKAGDFLKTYNQEGFFDIVCLFDTYEHLQEPNKYLEKIYKVLKKEGLVVIQTGDIGAILPRIYKSKWRLIDPRVHLSYFSKKTLTEMLKKHGFEILSVSYPKFHRSLNQILSLQFNLGTTYLPNFLKEYPVAINTFDLMFVVAKKS